MLSLSKSYARTLELLDEGKVAEAGANFQKEFVATVKKLYSEAAQTYPLRFKKAENWCD